MSESNSPSQNFLGIKLKKDVLLAVGIGLLTFVVTPIIAMVIAVLFSLLRIVAKGIYPVVIIAELFNLRELSGYFATQIILVGFIALIGDVAVGAISWLINHSKRLAVISFVSALTFQIIYMAIVLPATLKKSQEVMNAGVPSEESFEQYAAIGDVSYEITEPFLEHRGINGKLVEVSLSRKLAMVIPIYVLHAGPYQINAQYSDSQIGSTPIKDIMRNLDAGANTVKIEFFANESRERGYLSPKSVRGTAQIQLSYLASSKELFDKIKSDSRIDKNVLNQFLKDERLRGRDVQSETRINKFVERKEVKF